jgi:hypothetical protein
MSEASLRELREKIAELGARDPSHKRFGATAHRYELAPPLSTDELAVVEATLGCALPTDVRNVALHFARGGAGPAYGWIALDRVQPYALPSGARAIPLADYGCGQIVALALDDGAVWLDARGRELCRQLHDSFIGWYSEWYVRLSRNVWPSELVDNTTCILAIGLSAYLATIEQQLGIAAGSLAGDALREALGRLGPGSIEIAAEGPPELFDPGDLAYPCRGCAGLVSSFAADGLSPDVVAPGVRPRPQRSP